ncbi:MAG: MogA/MoaB family molybdenum cofactor biosynthesis protein [Pirellulaceae bacterium]|jgi:molybdenum cofactor biosynthesis protein B|nr:MogA/MoaB family molybdenum cofactor biosynthesis protein [Pirellulaceae bacterium]
MTATHVEHKSQGPAVVRCAVLTISDTRTLANDIGGDTLIAHLTAAGHVVATREIIPDDPQPMRSTLLKLREQPELDAILMTGGTGISRRDQTFETVNSLLDKVLPGYGELFRQLSYLEIGPAAILSRAVGGLLGSKVLLTMPGSPAAVRLAMERIVVPELSHLVREARR